MSLCCYNCRLDLLNRLKYLLLKNSKLINMALLCCPNIAPHIKFQVNVPKAILLVCFLVVIVVVVFCELTTSPYSAGLF